MKKYKAAQFEPLFLLIENKSNSLIYIAFSFLLASFEDNRMNNFSRKLAFLKNGFFL